MDIDEYTYVTFGQIHQHVIPGVRPLDKDTIAAVKGDRNEVFRIFGAKFAFTYTYEDLAKVSHYFPGGVVIIPEGCLPSTYSDAY